jgi:undecaprenyl diphosphate synthase
MTTTSTAPRHIAVVMDGNGRWAAKRGRPRSMGHQAGLKALRRIVEHCGKLGIAELTVFAFSSENWNRPKQEVSRLMDLFMRALGKETRELHENGVKLRFIGDLSAFSPALQKNIGIAVENPGKQRMTLNVAVNYGRWISPCRAGTTSLRTRSDAGKRHRRSKLCPPPDAGGKFRA